MADAKSAAARAALGAGSGLLYDENGSIVDATELLQSIADGVGADPVTSGPYTLDTAGEATSAITARGVQDHTFSVVVSLNGGTSVTMRFQGSLTRTNPNWFNLNDANTDTTYSADGARVAYKSAFACPYVRALLVSKEGAAASAVVRYYGGR